MHDDIEHPGARLPAWMPESNPGQVSPRTNRHNASIISNFVRMLLEGVTRLLLVNLL